MAIALLSTLDTKGCEIAFLKACLLELGRTAIVIDVGLFEPDGIVPDVSRFEVAASAGADIAALIISRPRDEVMSAMGRGAGQLLRRLHAAGHIEGALGIGGNQGTSIVCAGLRELPLGFPKLVVSTVASGNMRPYVGVSDIAVVFSICDLLGGANPVSAPVLRNAAAAMAGMSSAPAVSNPNSVPLVAITALGNTHPAVARSVQLLRAAGLETAAFHASGACGSAMERLIRAGRVAAVLEITPHELTEEVVNAGPYRPAEPGRMTAAADMGIPQVVAPGSVEYLCFGPRESIPARLRRRATVFHNPSNANVRTSRKEMAAVGRVMAERLNRAKGPVAFVLPLKGWSIYGAPGGPLHDARADAAFVRALTRGLRPAICVHRLPLHINDPAFAEYCCELLRGFLLPGSTDNQAGVNQAGVKPGAGTA
ncbi:MAG: Tm-1-like ATP-binding domain-containing protein [Candidatus Korobacteraceae bacterium]